MKTYTHKNGMKAEQTTSQLFDGPRYNVKINKGVIGYNLFQFPVAEQELLDFGFVEDKQEELNTKSLEGAINSFKSCKIQTKPLDVDNLIEKLKQAVKDNPDKNIFIIDMNDKQEDIDRDDQFNIIGEYEGKYVIIVKKLTLDRIMKVYGKSLGDLDKQEDWIDKLIANLLDAHQRANNHKEIYENMRQAILKHLPK